MFTRIKEMKRHIDILRGVGNRTLNRLVGFHPDFLGIAFRKLKRLELDGMRCTEIVLEDEDGKTAHVDRWGKVTWDS